MCFRKHCAVVSSSETRSLTLCPLEALLRAARAGAGGSLEIVAILLMVCGTRTGARIARAVEAIQDASAVLHGGLGHVQAVFFCFPVHYYCHEHKPPCVPLSALPAKRWSQSGDSTRHCGLRTALLARHRCFGSSLGCCAGLSLDSFLKAKGILCLRGWWKYHIKLKRDEVSCSLINGADYSSELNKKWLSYKTFFPHPIQLYMIDQKIHKKNLVFSSLGNESWL